MRPIKFRAKRIDNGEWVYGDLAHSTSCRDGVTSYHTLIAADSGNER